MICDDLKSIFPKYASTGYYKEVVTIVEPNSGAKVKKVTWTGSNFQYIEPAIVKDMTAFFRTTGTPAVFHSDCDGIILFQEGEKKYLFFSELKSTFDSSDIYHAKDQIVSSFLKINMVMHLLPCYQKEDYIVKGFIFSHPPKKSYLIDLHKEHMMGSQSKYKTEADLVLDICYYDNHIFRPIDFHCLKGLPIGGRGIFNQMELYHIPVPDDQPDITLDVHCYI